MAEDKTEEPMTRTYSRVPVPGGPVHHARVRLQVVGIRRRRTSFTVRVFVNAPDADHTTPTDDPACAGFLFMYGAGPSENPDQPFVEGDSEELSGPHEASLNITRAVERLEGVHEHLDITLVPVDEEERPLPASVFQPEEIFLTVSD